MDAPGLGYGIDLFLGRVGIVVGEGSVGMGGGIGTVSVLGRIWGAAPGVHGGLAALLIAGGGTGIEWAVMVEHWAVCESMREGKGERKTYSRRL